MPNKESYRPRGPFIIAGLGALLAATVIVITWTMSVSAQADSWAISKTANATNVHVGDEVIYTITFTNTGIAAQTGTMTDQIPYGVTYVGGSVTGGSYDSGTGSINWSGSLALGASHSVSFRVLVVEPGTAGPLPILNDAQIDGTWSNQVIIYSRRPSGVIYLPIIMRNYDPNLIWPWSEP